MNLIVKTLLLETIRDLCLKISDIHVTVESERALIVSL